MTMCEFQPPEAATAFWQCTTARHGVLGWHTIHGLLSGGVRVDGGHQALLDSNALLEKYTETQPKNAFSNCNQEQNFWFIVYIHTHCQCEYNFWSPSTLQSYIRLTAWYSHILYSHILLQQDMDDRSQAVGGARGVGHHIVVGLVVLGVVHTANLSGVHIK